MAAVTLAVTPNTVSNLYAGILSLQIGGLTNGETILVERFLDLNTNGAVDTGEPLVQSFHLTDGQTPSIGGVHNINIPGDNDLTANGQITATLNFANGDEFSRANASQLLRVSSPSGRFSPVLQTLTVTQSFYAQKITGTVSSSGTPLPNAMVGVLVQVGTDERFIAGTVADGSGNFSINVSNGTYVVVGFKPGYIGSFATGPTVTVSGANTNVTVPLTAAGLTFSGTVSETGTGLPIPGIQFFGTSTNNEYLVIFSDSSGNFSVSLVSGQWKLDASDQSLMLGGYMRPQNKTKVSLSTSVSGVSIQFPKGSALIYGTVKDDQTNALPGVKLQASDSGNIFNCITYSDASGNYSMAVSNSSWYLGPDSSGQGLAAGYTLAQVTVTVTNGQAYPTNLVARRATAYLVGQALDANSNPIGGATMFAFGTNAGATASAQTGNDGSFAVPLSGGTWTLSIDTQTAATRLLVAPQLGFNVTDGTSISNINYVAPLATRTIYGSVKTWTNSPVSGLNVFAGALVNGTNYNAGVNTDGSGNFAIPVLPAVWNVGVDTFGLQQRGFGPVFSQSSDTTSANQTNNFVVGVVVGNMIFRINTGPIGEFGSSRTPVVTYPVALRNYRVLWHVYYDTNPPDPSTVLFTGPPGSGMTNLAADPGFGISTDGTNVFYLSLPAGHINPPGGNWTVTYRTNANNFVMPDPQSGSRLVVPLPTVTVSNDVLRSLTWTYKDMNGFAIAGTPAFIATNRIDLFDQNGNLFDAEVFPATTSYSYVAPYIYNWSTVGVVRMDYYDTLGNQYFESFTESRPTITGASRLTGQRYQFALNGPALQNYTVQFSTNLAGTNWNTLLVTNPPSSPVIIVDPAATNAARFYRILIGP